MNAVDAAVRHYQIQLIRMINGAELQIPSNTNTNTRAEIKQRDRRVDMET